MIADLDKRWLRREERWVRPDRAIFSPDGYGVEPMPGSREAAARAFVIEHHYAASYPASRLPVGLFHKAGPCADKRLVGVAIFSNGMPKAVAKHTGLSKDEACELGRFVCLPEVAYNGETWFLARAFPALKAEKAMRSVLSYADPVERHTAEGHLCKPAHAGTIYKASNAAFVGRSEPRWFWMKRDGTFVQPRDLTKIRKQEQGHPYATRELIEAGAEPRRFGEDPAAWLKRVLREPTFTRIKHPGNFTYVFGLDRETRRAAAAKAQPYPEIRRAA